VNDLPEVRDCLIQILQALPGLPQRLHLSAGEVTVELEWPAAAVPADLTSVAAVNSAATNGAATNGAATNGAATNGAATNGAAPDRTVADLPVAASPMPANITSVDCAAVNAATMSKAAANGGTNGAPPDLVCAPSVGTFYRSPEPGAPPFVTEGDLVQSGQQIAIVEAMKLMLPVEAARAGRVTRVLKTDGEPVEYGEPLIELAALGESGGGERGVQQDLDRQSR
jgi:acetyl-CoA carboxylase biotin carboxyl carrier protein